MATQTVQDNNDLNANQLLNFVSNASKELKNMLGKVCEKTDDSVNQTSSLGNSSLSLPAAFNSPIPSPTPSFVSSISDQEVPSMSPKYFGRQKSQQPGQGRKRAFDSSNESPSVDYHPTKVQRADSTGDYEEFIELPSIPQSTSPQQQYYNNTAPAVHYQQHQQMYNKPMACGQQYSMPNRLATDYEAHSSRLQSRYQYQNDVYCHGQYVINNTANQRIDWPVQAKLNTTGYNTGYCNNAQNVYMNTLQQQEQYPDIADLVSWMVAENFLDNESLNILLTNC
eukprot:gene8992-9953_t